MGRSDLTGLEWSAIAPLLPNKPQGVPRVDDRRVLGGILWVLRTGAPRRDLPGALRALDGLLQPVQPLAQDRRSRAAGRGARGHRPRPHSRPPPPASTGWGCSKPLDRHAADLACDRMAALARGFAGQRLACTVLIADNGQPARHEGPELRRNRRTRHI